MISRPCPKEWLIPAAPATGFTFDAFPAIIFPCRKHTVLKVDYTKVDIFDAGCRLLDAGKKVASLN